METMTVGSHESCMVMESGDFRLAVTTKVGPRVIGGWIGDSDNIFVVLPPLPMDGIDTGFVLYGGHRLWHAPEAAPRTYAPDNNPVEVRKLSGGAIEFSSGIEAENRIEKSIAIKPLGNARFELTHTLTNRNPWSVRLAPWALSQMTPGGCAVIPQSRRLKASPYAVERSLHLWPYSNLADPRLIFTDNYILLRQDPSIDHAFKLGYGCRDGWIAYAVGGVALVKHIEYDPSSTYPDFGCNVESYSCGAFLEIETLGRLVELEPDADIKHVEIWSAISNVGEILDEDTVTTQLVDQLR